MVMVQRCRICAAEVPSDPRYPNTLCGPCGALACDEHGRRLRFSNETMLGAGFVAEVDDGGIWRRRDTGDCYVNGIHCIADEHRFGGIVIQAVDRPKPSHPT